MVEAETNTFKAPDKPQVGAGQPLDFARLPDPNQASLSYYKKEARRLVGVHGQTIDLLVRCGEQQARIWEYRGLMAKIDESLSPDELEKKVMELDDKQMLHEDGRNRIQAEIDSVRSLNDYSRANAILVEMSMTFTREDAHSKTEFNPETTVRGCLVRLANRRVGIVALVLGNGCSGDFYLNLDERGKKEFARRYVERAREEDADFYDAPDTPPTFFIVLETKPTNNGAVYPMVTQLMEPLNWQFFKTRNDGASNRLQSPLGIPAGT